MKLRTLAVVVSGTLAATLAHAAPPATAIPDYSGGWQINGNVQGTPFRLLCSLVQTGAKLAGTCSAEAADSRGPQKVAGSVKKGNASFSFETVFADNPISVSLGGSLSEDGSKMNGEIDVMPMGVAGDFQAIRLQAPPAPVEATPPVAPPAPAAPAAPAPTSPAAAPPAGGATSSGTWKVIGDAQGTPIVMTCALVQTDHALTGTCKGADSALRNIVGKTDGSAITWHFTGDYAGTAITVTMTGTIAADGASMNGGIHVMPMDVDGDFNARRQVNTK